MIRWIRSALVATSFASCVAMAQTELIVQTVEGQDPAAIATDYGVELLDTTPDAPFALMFAGPEDDVNQIEVLMQADPRIVFVEDNDEFMMPEQTGGSLASTIAAVGDPNSLYAWNASLLQQVGWSPAFAFAHGRKVRVGIVDTGLSPFVARLWARTDAWINTIQPGQRAWDVPESRDTDGDGRTDEGVGHGTLVAGIVDQVCPNALFVVAKAADSDGIASAWSVIKGLVFCVTSGAEVVNISLGAPRIPGMSDVMDWVEARRVVVVAAAGNDNRDELLSPADVRKTISVAGLLADGTKAPFSNFERGVRVSVPAVGFAGPWWQGGGATWSGTSFAAPIVTGALANALRLAGRRLPETIRDILDETGTDLDPANPGYRGELGVGLNIARLTVAAKRRGRTLR